jgi:hypothetical protein
MRHGQLSCRRTLVDIATAVTPQHQAHVLALQIKRLDHIVKSPESAQRERAVQHLAREF